MVRETIAEKVGQMFQMSRDNKMILGLNNHQVKLVDYVPAWRDLFAIEAIQIRSVLGTRAIDVQHVGSTSVPGLRAKPILDIAVGIENLRHGADCVEPLEDLGYDYLGADIVPGHHLFRKGEECCTHHLHVVEYEGYRWNGMIEFRDALRASPALVTSYQRLKERLSYQFADDRAAYTAAKSDFIVGVLAAAGDTNFDGLPILPEMSTPYTAKTLH